MVVTRLAGCLVRSTGKPFSDLTDHGVKRMKDDNYFDDVLTNVRKAVENHGDLTSALEDNACDLLHGITNRPLDCGARRFRSLTITRPSGEAHSGSGVRATWLLCVRAVDDGGGDIVAFQNGDGWLSAVVDFCYRAATNSVQWKPDQGPGNRAKHATFLDSLTSPKGNGRANGANVGAERGDVDRANPRTA